MVEGKAVACVGAGLIGRAWAIVFARGGHQVRLHDENHAAAEAARDFAEDVLPGLAEEGLLNGAKPAEVLARISAVHDIEEALSGASYVQESTREDLEVKRTVFARLDALADEGATIASSSSAILPSAFTENLAGRHRCLVVHPINPPYLVPAAEVVPAPWTDRAIRDGAAGFLRDCGMAPIVMEREIDGFVMNRMQGALLEEAFRLVGEGYASIEDVDVGIREGLALRWSFMGPFETIDLNAPGGVRDYAERYQQIYERLFPSMQHRVDWSGPVMDVVEAERRKRLPEDKLAERHIWRDRRLMALIAHKRRAAQDIGE
ncbi:3-hydroxyacyl-CoA dehydrogenase [Ostreiculturibacter nitratireducens]|uniref:3-hydroxyacyl-CoA dehydrogenase n=1 Tax=Ostreiculturibacter nitratireducens TaxID=3075226 RepID=UPI0031B62735